MLADAPGRATRASIILQSPRKERQERAEAEIAVEIPRQLRAITARFASDSECALRAEIPRRSAQIPRRSAEIPRRSAEIPRWTADESAKLLADSARFRSVNFLKNLLPRVPGVPCGGSGVW